MYALYNTLLPNDNVVIVKENGNIYAGTVDEVFADYIVLYKNDSQSYISKYNTESVTVLVSDEELVDNSEDDPDDVLFDDPDYPLDDPYDDDSIGPSYYGYFY